MAEVRRPVGGRDYPRAYQEFRSWFPDELTCREYLAGLRWPHGFSCPGCGSGASATGRTFTIAGIDIYRVADEQLCEHWHVIDQLGMLAQLGLLPQPAAA